MSSLVDTSVFGLYEIFSNIIPGFIVLVTLWEFVESVLHVHTTIIDSSIFPVFFVFLSFILGVAIQAASAPFEKFVFRISHGGYPSSTLLDEADKTFPDDFKKSIRRLSHEKLGIPRDSDCQHIFDLCYTYVVQNNISKRVSTFLNMYSFSRNMSVAMLLEAVVLFIWARLASSSLILALGVLSALLAILFYNRFMRYSRSFSTEVFRSFYIDQTKRETTSGKSKPH
jgi:hypothetical protein